MNTTRSRCFSATSTLALLLALVTASAALAQPQKQDANNVPVPFGLVSRQIGPWEHVSHEEYGSGQWIIIIDWYRRWITDVTQDRLNAMHLDEVTDYFRRHHPRGLSLDEALAELHGLWDLQLRGLGALQKHYAGHASQPGAMPLKTTLSDVAALPPPSRDGILAFAGRLAAAGQGGRGLVYSLEEAMAARNPSSGAALRRLERDLKDAVRLLDPAERADVWKRMPVKRGSAIEAYLAFTEYKDWFHKGASVGGKSYAIDFERGNDLVSLKTADTNTKTWAAAVQRHVENDLAGIAKRNPDKSVTLDVRVPPGGKSAAQRELGPTCRKNGVGLRVSEF